jgi:hypothetical protein
MNQSFAQDKAMTVKDLIAKHLASIGKPETLAGVKSRGLTGQAMVNFIQGASGSLKNGTFLCVSDGNNIGLTMKFNDINYPGEYLAYNGKEVSVKDIAPGKKSPLADFIFSYNALVKEGFLGGVLSVAWPLLNHREGQPEFQIKQDKIKDYEFYVLEKNIANNIAVKLFFDSKTFRHMRTEYRVRHKNNIAANSSIVTNNAGMTAAPAAASARGTAEFAPNQTIRESEPDSIYTLIEKFDLHAVVGGKASGLVLPSSYGIEFSLEGHGQSFLAQWSVLVDHWMNNGQVDQNFFIASK